VGEESLFIDIMMNVAVIFYAARETTTGVAGDRDPPRLTTRRYLVPRDGSTAHEGIFDAGQWRVSAAFHAQGTGAIPAGRAD